MDLDSTWGKQATENYYVFYAWTKIWTLYQQT